MTDTTFLPDNKLFIVVSGAGLPEVDGLYIPSQAPSVKSESGVVSTQGYWNEKMAWDRADGKAERSPAISYSNSYQSWRICRLDGHLAYESTCKDVLPPTNQKWNVYKMGQAPAPKIEIHHIDPRLPCPEPNVVFVLGGPGAGKGTMCELAEIQLGWTHLSTGDLLRAEQAAGGETTKIIKQYIAAGKLVPNEIVIRLLKDAMEHTIRTTGKRNFLIDGFPRSLSNLEAWYEVFGDQTELPSMIYFECPLEVLEQRILGRAKYSGRADDNVNAMKLRFDTFKQETLPTVELFKGKNKCIELDTSQGREAVYKLLRKQLAPFTSKQLMDQALTQQAEILLGLRPYPKRVS